MAVYPETCLETGSQPSRLSHPATERHSNAGDIIRDIIIGFADGLTVPFALTAGLSSLGSSKLVIVGGLAELFSGSISMGLGAYLAAVTDRDRYVTERKREEEEVRTKPEDEKEEIYDIFSRYGVSRDACQGVIDHLVQDEEAWLQFMMDFELKLEQPDVSRAWISAVTMGLSYFIGIAHLSIMIYHLIPNLTINHTNTNQKQPGGLLPMIPYFAMHSVLDALFASIGITFVILLVFGFVKNYVTVQTKRSGVYGAVQTLLVGALAAGTSYGIVYGIDHSRLE
ncbi:protein CCC1, putative [Paecilomyces variotii No. 5]|uniref:Protein CCC1, putative n=1 Tax=Byssochlamys spectabilis (strain No. 5 / NBRC 109023) TaxID=1356009 RepID=V5G8U0_BYSSN|nr:protein CCC1, putative [Paecilomyces variotii No. 5]